MNFDNQGIWGVDVSKYQRLIATSTTPAREINFKVMKDRGTRFVIPKAGQGLSIDPGFIWNWTHAKEALIPRGSYYFEDKDESPQEQARHYWNLIKNDIGEGVHAMDFENGSHTDLDSAYVFLNEFQQKSGLPDNRIAVYTGYPFWNAATNNADRNWFKRFLLWLAWYPEDPLNYLEVLIPKPWDDVYMWQNATPPIGLSLGAWSKDIDHDILNGGEDKLEYYFGKTDGGTTMPDITFTGTVKAGKNGVVVRNAAGGTDTGNRLNELNPIQGIGTLVNATLNGTNYQWMNIVSPFVGWVATVNLDYKSVTIPSTTHKLEIFIDGVLDYSKEF